MYWRLPTVAELKGESYVLQDFIDNEPVVEVWEENWEVLMLFQRYATQWRMAMHGPVALDYSIFFHELDRQGKSGNEYDELIEQLRIVESVAIKWVHR